MALLSAVIGAVSSRNASKSQRKAADKAGEAQLEAARIANDEIGRQFDLSRQDQQPWQQAGQNALSAQQQMLFGPPGGGSNAGGPQRSGYDPTTDPHAQDANYFEGQRLSNDDGSLTEWGRSNMHGQGGYNPAGGGGLIQPGGPGITYGGGVDPGSSYNYGGTPGQVGFNQNAGNPSYSLTGIPPAWTQQEGGRPPGYFEGLNENGQDWNQSNSQTLYDGPNGTPRPNPHFQGGQPQDPYRGYNPGAQPGGGQPNGPISQSNFDSEGYLNANPDVRAEMESAGWADRGYTPWDHYQENGQFEGRDLGQRQSSQGGGPGSDGFNTGGNLPSNAYQGTQLPGRNYADFSGPDARGQPGSPKMFEGFQSPDMFGREARPEVGSNFSSQVGVDAPEFVDPDLSFEGFQNSAPYEAMLFSQEQGNRGNAARHAAQGLTGSGREDKELSRYNAGVANQFYGQYYDQATARAQDENRQARDTFTSELGLSREGYGRQAGEFGRGRELYGDAASRAGTLYGEGRDIYEGQRGQAGDIYQSGRDQYGATVGERNQQFNFGGQLYGEQYGAATDTYNRGIGDFNVDYQNTLNNYNLRDKEYSDYYNRLAGLSGGGQTAATNVGRFGADAAGRIASNTTNAGAGYGNALIAGGNAQAAGYMGMGNAAMYGINSAGNYLMRGG